MPNFQKWKLRRRRESTLGKLPQVTQLKYDWGGIQVEICTTPKPPSSHCTICTHVFTICNSHVIGDKARTQEILNHSLIDLVDYWKIQEHNPIFPIVIPELPLP